MSAGVSRRPGEGFDAWFLRRLEGVQDYVPQRIGTFPAGFRPAGVLIPVWRREGRVEMALTLRTQTLSSHRGQISFPGGRRDPEDVSIAATALRETEEELGIPADRVRVRMRLDDAWSLQRYIVAPHVGWLDEPPAFVPSPAEIERVIVADVEALMSPACHRIQRVRQAGVGFDVHYFEYEGDTIWGLTGGILYTLFQLLRGEPIADESRGAHTLSRFLGASS